MKVSYVAILSLALAPTIALADLGDNINARQPFTGVYLQGGLGFAKNSMTTIVNSDYPALASSSTVSHNLHKNSLSGQIAAGYRFALNSNLIMGVGILGDVSQSKSSQDFTYNLLPAGTYTVNVQLSHDYAISTLLEFGYATSKNMVSVFAGPTITQLGRVASSKLNGTVPIAGPIQNYYTKAGFTFGGGIEHLLTPSLGVYLRGMYTHIPNVVETTQVLALNTINAKNAHTYAAQVGIEISFA